MTLLENKYLPNCDYFAIVPSCTHSIIMVKYATTGLVCALLHSIRRIKDLPLYGQVVIKTVNVIISRCFFAEDGTDLFIRACCTCSTLSFSYSTNQILNLWRCGCCCRSVVNAKALNQFALNEQSKEINGKLLHGNTKIII